MKKFVVAFVLFSIAGFTQTQTSSVADAAKDKPQKKARRVITNDDIPSRPEPEPVAVAAEEKKDTSSSPSGGSAESAKPEAENGDAEKSSHSEDSETVKAAQKKVDDLKARLDSIQQQVAETEKKIDGTTDDQVRDALVAARDGKKEFAEDLTKQLAEAEKQLQTAKGGSEKAPEAAKDTADSKPPSE